MPADLGGDEIGAPVLCPDHKPVIGNAKHLDGLDQATVANARAERARQCPDCYALNDRRLR
jgi:hypothetical protein